jgi:two-component system response regulator
MPAIVLLDLQLPKVDGLEVLRRIRADGQTTLLPVVILTSSKEEQDKLNGFLIGANIYMQKPVEIDKFVKAAEELNLYWQVLEEPLRAI